MSGRPFFVDAAQVLADHQRGRGALAGRADELFRGCSPKNFLARLQSWHQFVPYILMVVGSVIGVDCAGSRGCSVHSLFARKASATPQMPHMPAMVGGKRCGAADVRATLSTG